MSLTAVMVLLPYLLAAWSVWHALRLIRREDPYNELTPAIFIGRRLKYAQLPDDVQVIVDLTCEFIEPRRIKGLPGYQCFPILDGSVPAHDDLVGLVDELARDDRKIFIHCAEGHGRTALVAAALILRKGLAQSPQDAVKMLLSCRPLIRMAPRQIIALEAVQAELTQNG